MNKNMFAICALTLVCAGWPLNSTGQVTVARVTTTAGGTIEQFAPDSELVLRGETGPEPTRYVVTRETRFVDEAGTPVTVERITRGVPVRVEVERSGDRVIVSRVIVQKAPVIEQRTTTTTTTTERTLTHDEKERLEKERKAQEKYEKKVREAEKERAEKLKDAAKD